MVYILSPTLVEDQLEAAHARVQEIVAANAEVDSVEDWGRRRLAYEIEDHREGSYAVITFRAGTDAPREIDRLMKLQTGLLRHLIVRLNEKFVPATEKE